MNGNGVVIGIDTSNYTTSAAVMRLDGGLVANIKQPLAVKMGERGLRQSVAVFSHVKNLPLVMSRVREAIGGERVVAVGVSEKPRNTDGSYMPCFLSGVAAAESISCATDTPLYRFSHQCGHIMAAIYSSGNGELLNSPFAAYHVSGGTCELLSVNKVSLGFDVKVLGGTLDLNAGQLIDRVGVYMGLGFPAGREMEKLALTNTRDVPKAGIRKNNCYFNLSGIENKAIALFKESGDMALTSAFVFHAIAEAITKSCCEYVRLEGERPFLFAGGVMSNSIIKSLIKKELPASSYFAKPDMSSDNAVGIAALTLLSLK